jgi:hypothetical protein
MATSEQTIYGTGEIDGEVALWGTQASDGKGLARWDSDKDAYVWHELPNWAEKTADSDPDKPKLGEPIHPEMDLIPANAAAREEMHNS